LTGHVAVVAERNSERVAVRIIDTERALHFGHGGGNRRG
jgi:hypothetical protein